MSVLASTALRPVYRFMDDDEWHPRSELLLEPLGDDSPGYNQTVMEFAGRACYEAFGRSNEATAQNADYLANITDHAHYSVIEHSSVSLYIEGVSRSLTHELVRHRHFSYSQLSQRYVPAAKMGYVVPPALLGDLDAMEALDESFEQALDRYTGIENSMLRQGHYTTKQRRETARAVLPNMTETRLVITGNFRSWMEFIIKRDTEAADAEIQRLAQHVGAQLAALAPAIFGPVARAKWHDRVAQEPSSR